MLSAACALIPGEESTIGIAIANNLFKPAAVLLAFLKFLEAKNPDMPSS
jgi:hypothetical protein